MKLSVELPIAAPDALMTCALAIEAAGFDACFVTDHPFPSRTWLETGGHETLDPFVALHAAGVYFLDRAISMRLDVIGAYGLNRAVIRFGSEDVAEVGRPMLTSTLSLAIAWP